MIKAFPKIFAIGQDYIKDIFKEEVEITEKIDGSQFVFGKLNGELFMRSKGAEIYADNPQKMFKLAVDYVLTLSMPDNTVYYCEYLAKPKHNTLCYERIPKNNLMLFGIATASEKFMFDYELLKKAAKNAGIEPIPLVYKGKISKADEIFELIKKKSVLGGVDMEGIVVKNYARPFLLGGQPIPLMAGKYVSEHFKEVHQKSWGRENTARGKFEVFKDNFRTDARWDKSIQHLRDNGELENAPKDIGKLIKAIQQDITDEEQENIKAFLWKEFSRDILRFAVKGFPEYYKEKLLKSNFE